MGLLLLQQHDFRHSKQQTVTCRPTGNIVVADSLVKKQQTVFPQSRPVRDGGGELAAQQVLMFAKYQLPKCCSAFKTYRTARGPLPLPSSLP